MKTSRAENLSMNKAEYIDQAMVAGRVRMNEQLLKFAGQRGVDAASSMTDAEVASVIWSLHGMALCKSQK